MASLRRAVAHPTFLRRRVLTLIGVRGSRETYRSRDTTGKNGRMGGATSIDGLFAGNARSFADFLSILMALDTHTVCMKYKSPHVTADPPSTAETPDVIAVRSVIDRMRDTWAAGDATGYADCFSQDSDYVTYNGMHLHGREANAQLHGALFRGVLKGTRISARIEGLAFLSPNVALIHTAGAGAQRGRESSPRRKSIQTLVAVKQDQQWRIRSFHNVRIRPFSVWLTRMATRQRS